MRPIERPSRSASFQLPPAGVTITSTVNPSSRKPSGTRLVERVNEVPRVPGPSVHAQCCDRPLLSQENRL